MDKKQRLRVRTPESSAIATKDHSSVSFTRDSSILVPHKITMEESSEKHARAKDDSIEFDQSDNLFSHLPEINQQISGTDLLFYLQKTAMYARKYWACILVASLFAFILFKPQSTDYQFLLDEIEKLKKENVSLQVIKKVENAAEISCGTTVPEHSEIYRYGFFKSIVSDPDAILEPGMSCLPLVGQSGFFEVKLKFAAVVSKIGLYHPEVANPRSSIRNFTIIADGKRFEFVFKGSGYEEFSLEDVITDRIRVEYSNNYGETKYTCIYRIFVFI